MTDITHTHPSLKPVYIESYVNSDLKRIYFETSDVRKHTIDKAVLKNKLKEFYSPKYADECSIDLEELYSFLYKELKLEEE